MPDDTVSEEDVLPEEDLSEEDLSEDDLSQDELSDDTSEEILDTDEQAAEVQEGISDDQGFAGTYGLGAQKTRVAQSPQFER